MTIGEALFSISGFRFLDADIVRSIVIGSGGPPDVPQLDNRIIMPRDEMTLKKEEIQFTNLASDMD